MARYLHYISEGEIRDQWYAKIVEELNNMGIDNVNILELIVNGNQRSDLVTYVCKNGNCSPLFLFEFKNQFKNQSRISHAKICQQAKQYASIIKPLYTVIVDLINSLDLYIYQDVNNICNFNSILNYNNHSFKYYLDLFDYFFRGFLPQHLSVPNFTTSKINVIY